MSKVPTTLASDQKQMLSDKKSHKKKFKYLKYKKPLDADTKAKRVTFYRNGDYFDCGVHVPIQGRRHFKSFGHLCDYLTQKTKLPDGVRFIFNEDGYLIKNLEDFENGCYYVVSSNKHFQSLPYGGVSKVRTARTGHALAVREDDLKLFRPLSPPVKKVDKNDSGVTLKGSTNFTLPSSRENRVITVVKNSDHSTRSSVLFNIRTVQSFEAVLQDLGQAVRLRKIRKMMTPLGQEVRSLSQLKNDFREIETFYLEGEEIPSRDFDVSPRPRKDGRSAANRSEKSSKILENQNESNNKENTGYPSKNMELYWVHGYRAHSPGSNIYTLTTGELLYTVAAIIVLYERKNNTQRHYTQHTEEILSVCVHPSGTMVASSQGGGKKTFAQPSVHIWDIEDLTTVIIVGRSQLEGNIIGITFSKEGYYMLTVEVGKEEAITLWDWQNDNIVGRAQTDDDKLTGAIFHPEEESLFLTFGMHHLAFWRKANDGFVERKDALSPGHSGRTISSWTFLSDGSFVVGDSSGYITMWNFRDDDPTGFFISKEIKAHESEVNALLLLEGGTLLSGGKQGAEGRLLAWDTQNGLGRLGRAVLPEGVGGVIAICPQRLHSDDGNIYVGTDGGFILEGSIHRKFRPVVQSHQGEIYDLAASREELHFYTTGQDHFVCKWSLSSLIWDVKLQNECLSLSLHPRGSAIIAGSSSGKLIVLNSENGLVVSMITVCAEPIKALSYSSDGSVLAIASQDGNIYLYYTQNHGYLYKKAAMLKGDVPVMKIDWSSDNSVIQSVTSDNEFYELVMWDVGSQKALNPSFKRDLKWNEHNCTIGHNITGIWNGLTSKNVAYLCCHKSKSHVLLAAGDKDGFVRLFQYPCKDTSYVKYREKKHTSFPITTVRFLYSDAYLACTGRVDGAIILWKLL